MRSVAIDTENVWETFRSEARTHLAAGIEPSQIDWRRGGSQSLFHEQPLPASGRQVLVPKAFVALAEEAVCHSDDRCFASLYECLWRLSHGERHLLEIAADPLVHRLVRMAKAVKLDAYRMKAHVRFRMILVEGEERFVAWHMPEHRVLRRVADFFIDRFAGMDWAILTPRESMHWDRTILTFGPGAERKDAPSEDELEEWWTLYYRTTFNPARLKIDAMLAQMPKKLWGNLPEAKAIPEMIAAASTRMQTMITEGPSTPHQRVKHWAPSKAPERRTEEAGDLAKLSADVQACTRCPLYKDATQAVFGEGPGHAEVVLVGEQPGDQEDLAGRPFVGPAGQLLDRALADAGIDREKVYVTNAVKHFKFEPRGKRRIHKSPSTGEIDICRWWLDKEIGLTKPKLVVAMGASAARAVTGRSLTISKERGRAIPLKHGMDGLITVHPSFMLRLPDAESKAREYDRFVADLKFAAELVPSLREQTKRKAG
ncbi:DNA polymerase [Rhodoligotrophos appendicifer]|uniref:UdgX family uracil-DNA binding protein n=1 Tax=Rhodoligotrophos appendicifer TaxID=987056 RepID=UPI00117CDE7C|nr:UdgX family uracil-DNA binding protein [Rhodoligotrophos appendicifer]